MNEIDGETEEQRVRRMRNNYAIIDSNSLVRWMNSSKWTRVVTSNHARRGMRKRSVTVPVKYHADAMHGEIQCR